MSRIGIIGGGYAGLTAAYELQKQGHNVTVLEKYASNTSTIIFLVAIPTSSASWTSWASAINCAG
jgi:glycine/D-amino acid oxidase-like deaminating enzyme